MIALPKIRYPGLVRAAERVPQGTPQDEAHFLTLVAAVKRQESGALPKQWVYLYAAEDAAHVRQLRAYEAMLGLGPNPARGPAAATIRTYLETQPRCYLGRANWYLADLTAQTAGHVPDVIMEMHQLLEDHPVLDDDRIDAILTALDRPPAPGNAIPAHLKKAEVGAFLLEHAGKYGMLLSLL